MRWLYSITDSMDMTLSKLWEMVKDREAWHAGVHRAAKSGTRLSDWTTMPVAAMGEWKCWQDLNGERVILCSECLCPHPKFICWNPNPQWMVLEGGIFGKRLDAKGRVLINGISAHIKEALGSTLAPFHHIRTQQEICDWEKSPQSTTLAAWSQTSSLQHCEE